MPDISKQITKALSDYTNDVTDGLNKAKKEVAKDAVKDIKSNVESQDIILSGDYKAGWRAKKTQNGYVIHNKTDYQLTHLLEKGHAKRGGGRVPAYPHIRPAEEKAIEEYISRAEDVIKG